MIILPYKYSKILGYVVSQVYENMYVQVEYMYSKSSLDLSQNYSEFN